MLGAGEDGRRLQYTATIVQWILLWRSLVRLNCPFTTRGRGRFCLIHWLVAPESNYCITSNHKQLYEGVGGKLVLFRLPPNGLLAVMSEVLCASCAKRTMSPMGHTRSNTAGRHTSTGSSRSLSAKNRKNLCQKWCQTQLAIILATQLHNLALDSFDHRVQFVLCCYLTRPWIHQYLTPFLQSDWASAILAWCISQRIGQNLNLVLVGRGQLHTWLC